MQKITVSKDQYVQKVAEIGDVGTEDAHLHFEIREADHPNPTDGAYWTSCVLFHVTHSYFAKLTKIPDVAALTSSKRRTGNV